MRVEGPSFNFFKLLVKVQGNALCNGLSSCARSSHEARLKLAYGSFIYSLSMFSRMVSVHIWYFRLASVVTWFSVVTKFVN